MFNIGAAELILILLIAFIVVGPKDLPKVARFLGHAIRRVREMIQEIKKESGLDEVEKEIRETQREVNKTIREVDIREDIRQTQRELRSELNGVKKELDVSKDIREAQREVKKSLQAEKTPQKTEAEAEKDA